MAKLDLHVHSKHSDHPSEWFLQRIGASESYTEPDHIFQTALARGMDLVAITDHNTIAGALTLRARYPKQVLVGVEVTHVPASKMDMVVSRARKLGAEIVVIHGETGSGRSRPPPMRKQRRSGWARTYSLRSAELGASRNRAPFQHCTTSTTARWA
jgi:histidinol phosphatase-like PHP family hydrolase